MWFSFFGKRVDKKCDVGICVATSYCYNKKKRERSHIVYKGTLVKFIEYSDDKVIFTPVKVDLKLVLSEHANFECIDEDLYKYLNAIEDAGERLKFYKNIDRREFVLHLKEDTFVSVQFSKLQIKALFKRFIVNDKKNYISVELVEEPNKLARKELNMYSHNSSKKEFVYNVPANVIRKHCFIDVDRKIEENLIIDKTLWRCDVCLKENLKYRKACEFCSSYNPIEDGNYSSPSVNRNKSLWSGSSWINNEEDTKVVYPSNECYDQSYIDCFEPKQMQETDYFNGDFIYSDERMNKRRRNQVVSSDISLFNNSCIPSILEVSFKQGQVRFQDTLNHSELSNFQCDKHNFNGPIGLESTKIQCDTCVKECKDFSKNPLDIKPEISNTKMGSGYSKLDNNYQMFPDKVKEVPLIKPGLIGMWRCVTCSTKNDKAQCVECGEAYDIGHRSWSCATCTTVNNYEINICFECGDNKEEISDGTKTQPCVDPNLLVSTRLSIEMEMNPFETAKKSSDNNNITNPGDDLMEHHDIPVKPNIAYTECCFCKNVLNRSGIVLLCDHTFCDSCVNNHIISEKKCLAVTNNKPCERRLELSEIKCLLSSDKYKEFCAYLINLNDTNSYIERCYSKNCTGYYLWEKYYAVRPTEFRCNECKLNNCTNCAAIHVGLTCEKYKKLIGDGKSIDKETTEMFLTMIREGIAMQCPKCETLIEKDQGCDWVQCPLCETEICWATRGPRWGPNGKDDTSGGCGCTKEKLCVPSCNYCH